MNHYVPDISPLYRTEAPALALPRQHRACFAALCNTALVELHRATLTELTNKHGARKQSRCSQTSTVLTNTHAHQSPSKLDLNALATPCESSQNYQTCASITQQTGPQRTRSARAAASGAVSNAPVREAIPSACAMAARPVSTMAKLARPSQLFRRTYTGKL